MTCAAVNCCRQSLKLATCRSQPSRLQGTQAPAPCSRNTLPERWLPQRRHGLALASCREASSATLGRAGLCQARNLGLPELIADTPDAFVAAAVRLATDLDGLAQLRAGLRERLQGSPLMDAPRFVANLEAAYRKAWRRWCESTP